MKAAIYARKSTEQTRVAEEDKSVARQQELGRRFAADKDWTVSYVYVDDGISGAEFDRRPGFQQMKAAAFRGLFNVLIVSEQKSLGREAFETNYTIKELAEAGVEVVSYMDGRSLTPRSAMDKAMSSLRAFGDEAHREDSSKRGHESHLEKHRKGHVVGGRVFGYRNVDIITGHDSHGRPIRSHVVREVDEAEAAVVRRIFQLFAEGNGLKRISTTLAKEGAVSPKPFNRKHPLGLPPVGAWVPSTVRGVLMREDYRGVYVWNKTRKRTEAWGNVKQRPRPENEWQRTEHPSWRIISDELWNKVAARRQSVAERALRFSGGRLSGRPPATAPSNLLSGLATCGTCGGGLIVETYKASKFKQDRFPHYVCHRRRSNKRCTNTLRTPVEAMNEDVLRELESHSLTPEAVEAVIVVSEAREQQDRRTLLLKEQEEIQKRLARVVAAIEQGLDSTSLADKLRELEARKAALVGELADLRPVPRLPENVVEDRLGEWRSMLRESVTKARMVLERIIEGRITFTPRADGSGYDFKAQTRYDRLFAGVSFVPQAKPEWMPVSDGSDVAHIGVNDTPDGDYGRLLERVYRNAKRDVVTVASPPGFEPGFQP